jgi:hypothetical protein
MAQTAASFARTQFRLSQAREPMMSTEEKTKGPASYFPSIEKKYGQPIAHWIKLVSDLTDLKHMERVARLRSEHGIGHGHANAIVAYVLANTPKSKP